MISTFFCFVGNIVEAIQHLAAPYLVTRGQFHQNILRAAFAHADSKSVKRLTTRLYFFALLGSSCVKALRKRVGEIDLSSHGTKVSTLLLSFLSLVYVRSQICVVSALM